MSGKPDIYCPKCAYRPRAEDRWQCMPGCGTVWNTFWTRGICPGCSYAWQDTQCLACFEMSPHESWYHYPDDRDSEMSETEEDAGASHV